MFGWGGREKGGFEFQSYFTGSVKTLKNCSSEVSTSSDQLGCSK